MGESFFLLSQVWLPRAELDFQLALGWPSVRDFLDEQMKMTGL